MCLPSGVAGITEGFFHFKTKIQIIKGTYQAVELPEADKGKEAETIPATPDVLAH